MKGAHVVVAKDADARLEGALIDVLRAQPPVPARMRGRVGVFTGGRADWTISFDKDGISLAAGVDKENVNTCIYTDAGTFADVVHGDISGIDAFLDGRLRVRGDLNLSLRLTSLVPQPPEQFPMGRDVRVDGIDTFYLEAGSGPPVILLHGLGATNASLLTTMRELAADHHVIAPDLPGFGASSKPIRTYDAEFFATWLTSFMDRLGIDRAHVIGNSMGGRIAIEMGLRHPERVDRLCLLAPSPAFIKKREWTRVVRLLRPELAAFPLFLRRKDVVVGTKGMFARPSRLSDAWYEAAADEFIRVFSTMRGRIAFFSAARQIYLEEPSGEKGFWDRLEKLSPPALFIWGSHDRLVPAKFARHVERALPNARSVVLQGCGHVPQYELPDRTHTLVRNFLAAEDSLTEASA
jgi:pimeloyl-ACP methyl ester carboxylesterase